MVEMIGNALADPSRRIAEQSEGYKSIEAWFTAETPDLEPRPDDHWHLRELKLFVADYAARIAELEREREAVKREWYCDVQRLTDERRDAIARATAEKARADAAVERERVLRTALEGVRWRRHCFFEHLTVCAECGAQRALSHEPGCKIHAALSSPAPGNGEADPRPLDEWHEDIGDVLWWQFPVVEPPYCGSPIASDWPSYHTHWTPFRVPSTPSSPAARSEEKEHG
jgi:hypothetical protein